MRNIEVKSRFNVEKDTKGSALSQDFIRHHGKNLRSDPVTQGIFYWTGKRWKVQDDGIDIESVLMKYIHSGSYSMRLIEDARWQIHRSLPHLGEPDQNIIAFDNGLFNRKTGEFQAHYPEAWTRNCLPVDYTEPEKLETLETHAPNLWRFLSHAAGVLPDDKPTDNQIKKMRLLLAIMYAVMTNANEQQFYFEIVGPGGSGKSVFAEICEALAGSENTESITIQALSKAMERVVIVDKSFIRINDMERYSGDNQIIKALTGGDPITFNPKFKRGYSKRINAMLMITSNYAADIDDHSGGTDRRRILVSFPHTVEEHDRDENLLSKIIGELPVIVRQLVNTFSSVGYLPMREILTAQRVSEEARQIKTEANAFAKFVSFLEPDPEGTGLRTGVKKPWHELEPDRFLFHAYLQFMYAHNEPNPKTLTRFGLDLPGELKAQGMVNDGKTTGGVRYTGLRLKNEAKNWLKLPRSEEN